MHRGKGVGPKMEPWGTPGWTRHSCNDFSPRTTQSRLLLRNEELKSNTQPKIPKKNGVYEEDQHAKASDISNAAAQVAPDLLKALVSLSEKTIKRSAVEREDLKTY